MPQMHQGALTLRDGAAALILEPYALTGAPTKPYVLMRGLMVQVLGNEYKKRDCVSSNKKQEAEYIN